MLNVHSSLHTQQTSAIRCPSESRSSDTHLNADEVVIRMPNELEENPGEGSSVNPMYFTQCPNWTYVALRASKLKMVKIILKNCNR
jgi:hypothetical protein